MKRKLITIRYQGKTRTIAEWSEELGLSHHLIYERYKRGLKPKDILALRSLRERIGEKCIVAGCFNNRYIPKYIDKDTVKFCLKHCNKIQQ